MKKLLVLLFSIIILPLSANASDVYYCSDTAQIGFEPKLNFKSDTYEERKFKISIDFIEQKVKSKSIYMEDNKCLFNNTDQTLYCISLWGTAFSINKNTLRFARGEIYNKKNQGDSITLAHGTCEKF
tara:strand:- start:63 stop:443 length:381 start_codon:yes stop_codon:yes gene_type:complete